MSQQWNYKTFLEEYFGSGIILKRSLGDFCCGYGYSIRNYCMSDNFYHSNEISVCVTVHNGSIEPCRLAHLFTYKAAWIVWIFTNIVTSFTQTLFILNTEFDIEEDKSVYSSNRKGVNKKTHIGSIPHWYGNKYINHRLIRRRRRDEHNKINQFIVIMVSQILPPSYRLGNFIEFVKDLPNRK